MVRKIVIPHETQYTIQIPTMYLNKKIEILVLPFDNEEHLEEAPKELHLTTFRCDGKLRDFTRGDAYRESV